MKGFGGEIVTRPIEATMPSALATFVRSYTTPRRKDIQASINLDRSGTADFQYTRVIQDITKSVHIIITLKSLDNNIQGA